MTRADAFMLPTPQAEPTLLDSQAYHRRLLRVVEGERLPLALVDLDRLDLAARDLDPQRALVLGERRLEALELAVQLARVAGADVRLEHERDPGAVRGDRVHGAAHDLHHLVPVALDLREHRGGAVGQAGGADHGDGGGHRPVHGGGVRVPGQVGGVGGLAGGSDGEGDDHGTSVPAAPPVVTGQGRPSRSPPGRPPGQPPISGCRAFHSSFTPIATNTAAVRPSSVLRIQPLRNWAGTSFLLFRNSSVTARNGMNKAPSVP